MGSSQADHRQTIKSADVIEAIMSDNKNWSIFYINLSAINSAVELGSNFAEKIVQ